MNGSSVTWVSLIVRDLSLCVAQASSSRLVNIGRTYKHHLHVEANDGTSREKALQSHTEKHIYFYFD